LILKSPAKVNLYLKVLGKRSDGYHDIETVFEKIDLCDRIVLNKSRSGIRIVSDKKDLPTDKRNLAYKAASLLLKKAKSSVGITIEIEKNIPVSAGLGGGSSNAATLLVGLNKFYNFGLSLKELSELGKEIGADVPFFIKNYSYAKALARGDEIEPIEANIKLWHVLVMPNFGISSKKAYKWLDCSRYNRGTKTRLVLRALINKDLNKLNSLLYNSLQEPILARYAKLKRLKKDLLETGIESTLVSGSGPCVFGITKTRKEAKTIEKKLNRNALARKNNWQVYVAQTL